MSKVTFIGLGVMGYPMAGYIAKAGHDVTVYNRTTAKAEKWVKQFGGKHANTPKDAAKDSDFIFTCVGNDNDLKEVTTGTQGAFHSVKAGAVFIDNTTASAKIARELNAEAKKRNFGFLDAPVSGGQAGAENGQLTVMVGGDQKDYDKAESVIDHYSKKNKIIRAIWIWSVSKNGKSNLYSRFSSRIIRSYSFWSKCWFKYGRCY